MEEKKVVSDGSERAIPSFPGESGYRCCTKNLSPD
jgi:hypothetical protein